MLLGLDAQLAESKQRQQSRNHFSFRRNGTNRRHSILDEGLWGGEALAGSRSVGLSEANYGRQVLADP